MDTEADDEATAWETFRTSLWEPNRHDHYEGAATANIRIGPGCIVVTPRYQRWPYPPPPQATRIEYTWPTAIVERFKPVSYATVLLDIDGQLGSARVRGRRKLPDALSKAGFNMVKRSRWGWGRPHPIPRTLLGAHVDEVPACIVAD